MIPARLSPHRRRILQLIRALQAIPSTTREQWVRELRDKGARRTEEEDLVGLVLVNLRAWERGVENMRRAELTAPATVTPLRRVELEGKHGQH